MDQRLESLQTFAAGLAAASLALGFLAAIGLRIFPPLAPGLFWPVLLLLTGCGGAAGVLTVGRGHEIDRRRWEVALDPLITSGEREHAHHEAERERRWAGTVFFLAPLALAYWATYQFPAGIALTKAPLLALLPLGGYLGGLLAGAWRARDRPRPGPTSETGPR